MYILYIYIYITIYIHKCIHIQIHISKQIFPSIYLYMYVCICINLYICVYMHVKKPPKWQKNDLVSGDHGQACRLGGPWIGSAPVQTSGCGLDGALARWPGAMSCCWLWLFCADPSFLVDGQLGCVSRRVSYSELQRTGRRAETWGQVGLCAQSLPRRRFRRGLRAFMCTFCMCVCIYVYVCMCADMYIYIYVYVCTYM